MTFDLSEEKVKRFMYLEAKAVRSASPLCGHSSWAGLRQAAAKLQAVCGKRSVLLTRIKGAASWLTNGKANREMNVSASTRSKWWPPSSPSVSRRSWSLRKKRA